MAAIFLILWQCRNQKALKKIYNLTFPIDFYLEDVFKVLLVVESKKLKYEKKQRNINQENYNESNVNAQNMQFLNNMYKA